MPPLIDDIAEVEGRVIVPSVTPQPMFFGLRTESYLHGPNSTTPSSHTLKQSAQMHKAGCASYFGKALGKKRSNTIL
jgi:hypothetical protein